MAIASAATTDQVDTLLRQGDVAGALAAAESLAHGSGADLAAEELYVDLLIANGRGERALAEARANVAAAGADPDRQYLLGRATPDPAEAERAYRAALALAPRHARAWMGLAAVEESRGELPSALTSYQRALEGDARLIEAWVGRARTEIRLGKTGAALGTARSGLALHPSSAGLLVVLGHLAPAEADPKLASALRATPTDATLLDAYAETRLALGDARGAQAAAQQALAVDRSLGSAARTATFAREQLESRLDASGRAALASAADLAAYDALVAKYPRSGSVLLARSAARRARADAAGALTDLAAAAAADRANLEAQSAAGLALLDARRYAEAATALQYASAARPDDLRYSLARIHALAAGGTSAEALAAAEALARRYPYQPDVILADAAQLAGVGRAAEAYDRVKVALVQTGDPRLAAAFVQIAPAAGHPDEAAALLEQIVAATGNPQLAEAARRLRAMGAARVAPPP